MIINLRYDTDSVCLLHNDELREVFAEILNEITAMNGQNDYSIINFSRKLKSFGKFSATLSKGCELEFPKV